MSHSKHQRAPATLVQCLASGTKTQTAFENGCSARTGKTSGSSLESSGFFKSTLAPGRAASPVEATGGAPNPSSQQGRFAKGTPRPPQKTLNNVQSEPNNEPNDVTL